MMFSKDKPAKQRKLPLAFIMILAAGGLYIHGIRVIDISEVPSSHRPWQLVVPGEYQ